MILAWMMLEWTMLVWMMSVWDGRIRPFTERSEVRCTAHVEPTITLAIPSKNFLVPGKDFVIPSKARNLLFAGTTTISVPG